MKSVSAATTSLFPSHRSIGRAAGRLRGVLGVVRPAGRESTVEMPSAVNVVEGEMSVSFGIQTGVTTLNGLGRAVLVEIQAAYGGTTPTATLTVAPPLCLSSLSVTPGSVAVGVTATATLAATYGSSIAVTGTAKLAANPPAAQASGTVSIQRVEYAASKRQLSV